MQWSACGHNNSGSRVRSPDICWQLFYLSYYRRVAKDYPILKKNLLPMASVGFRETLDGYPPTVSRTG